MKRPAQVPGESLLRALRNVYWSERQYALIQYTPECSRHDDRLGYTLRPGQCTFSGPEFSNHYSINSLGLRDDEASLDGPEVIVLGDSQAMGWGVDQENTFAQQIEKRSGKRVLNAGVSSYGTAREIENLRRLDISQARTLVIQYCDNDHEENLRFYRGGNEIETMTATTFDELVRGQQAKGAYYFGKHLRYMSDIYWRQGGEFVSVFVGKVARKLGLTAQAPPAPAADEPLPTPGELFLNVLDTIALPADINVIVFDISNYGRSGHNFYRHLETALKSPARHHSDTRIKILDSADILGAENYYPLDGHMTASGHSTLASEILKHLQR
jgi:hypothetical protein